MAAIFDNEDGTESEGMKAFAEAQAQVKESFIEHVKAFFLVAIVTFGISTVSFFLGYLASRILDVNSFVKNLAFFFHIDYHPNVDVNEFFKQLFTSISVGIALFFINHIFVHFLKKFKRKFTFFCIFLSICTLSFSLFAENLMREYTRELGVGIMLLVCLEVMYIDWLEKLTENSDNFSGSVYPEGTVGGPSAVTEDGQ